MRVLVMSAIYPTPEKPAWGTFIRTEVESLKRAGVDVELLLLTGSSRKWNYLNTAFRLRRLLASNTIDLVHAHIAYVGMVARTQWKVPVVVTYPGSDLLGLVKSQGKLSAQSYKVKGRRPFLLAMLSVPFLALLVAAGASPAGARPGHLAAGAQHRRGRGRGVRL